MFCSPDQAPFVSLVKIEKRTKSIFFIQMFTLKRTKSESYNKQRKSNSIRVKLKKKEIAKGHQKYLTGGMSLIRSKQ